MKKTTKDSNKMKKTELEHSKYSPSAAGRWVGDKGCSGSINFIELLKEQGKIPEEQTNEFAQEGTLAHLLAATCLEKGKLPIHYIDKRLTDKHLPITEEMAGFVDDHLQRFIYNDIWNKENDINLIEEKVYPIREKEEVFGTLDWGKYDKKNQSISIVDLKYGQGVKVFAYNNKQLLCYLLGFISFLIDKGHLESNLVFQQTFTLAISQPRLKHYDIWKVSFEEVKKFREDLIKSIKEVDKGIFRPSTTNCLFCPASGNCKPQKDHFDKLIKEDFEKWNFQTQSSKIGSKLSDSFLTPEGKKKILDNRAFIEKFIKAVEAATLNDLLNGKQLEGYKVVLSNKRKVWNDSADSVLLEILGDARYQPLKLITATEAKILKVPAETLHSIQDQPVGEPTIAPVTDKRAEVNIVEHKAKGL